MARSADLNIHRSSSGLSYARAAKKFGVDEAQAKAYATMAKEYNRQARSWAKEYGYKGDLWKAPSLMDIARDKGAATRYGGVKNLFSYMQEDIKARLEDKPALDLTAKAEQYAANLIQALRNNPESAFLESDVSKAIEKLESHNAKWIMQHSGGDTLSTYYKDNNVETRRGVVQDILGW